MIQQAGSWGPYFRFSFTWRAIANLERFEVAEWRWR